MLLPTANRCMQDAHTYFLGLASFSVQPCPHLQIDYDCFTRKDYLLVFPSVQPRYSEYIIIACKTYLFMKEKYFTPIEMLYNLLSDRNIFTNIMV